MLVLALQFSRDGCTPGPDTAVRRVEKRECGGPGPAAPVRRAEGVVTAGPALESTGAAGASSLTTEQ